MKRDVERTHGAIAAAGIVLLVLFATSKSALAQESCARLIAAATDAYGSGQLEVVLERTKTCLAQRPSSSERESAFMLQSRALLALDDMAQAETAVRGLLQVNPDFAPAVDDPERFRTLVTTIKRELAREGVSSVSKMTESVPEAPATVIVVTGEQIRQRGYQDLEEVLHDLPGFDISRINGQSYSNIYQRGYRSTRRIARCSWSTAWNRTISTPTSPTSRGNIRSRTSIGSRSSTGPLRRCMARMRPRRDQRAHPRSG